MDWNDDDVRLGKCPRCGCVDPRQDEDPSVPAEHWDDHRGEYFALKTCRVCGLGGVPRSHIRGGYFRRDLLEVVDDLPRMGKPCYHCGARIPRFLDLATEDKCRIHRLARSGQEETAIETLMAVMGCPREWARLWVTHPMGPRRPARVWIGPPCSRCGRPLRTRLARQCFECGLDWHDTDPSSGLTLEA